MKGPERRLAEIQVASRPRPNGKANLSPKVWRAVRLSQVPAVCWVSRTDRKTAQG